MRGGAIRGGLLLMCAWVLVAVGVSPTAYAELQPGDYLLSAGDALRIMVFQNPDLTLEARVTESGAITYPLVGSVRVGGLSVAQAEQVIAKALRDGGFVQQPQVNILLTQIRGSQVSVLGQVNRPGRYPLENPNTRLSEVLATAGGIAATGADTVILVGRRDGQIVRREVDVAAMYLAQRQAEDLLVAGGDTLYVHRAPTFYVYGEVQRAGSYRLERNMTIRQALAQGGGPTQRGTESRLRLHRRGADGTVSERAVELDAPVYADDVLYVRESLF